MYSYRIPREPNRKNRLDYRLDLTRDLLLNLHRGECCAVVGVGSCGKTRLLSHITRPDVMEYHLGQEAYNHFIVLVECNSWVSQTTWAGYEGMTRSLMDMLNNTNHPILAQAARTLENFHSVIVQDKDIAPVNFMKGIDELLKGKPIQLTFCFDEFDFVFEKFDSQFFRNLRALRNHHKYQLTYLTATRRQLPFQRPLETREDVEEFYELFTDNTYAIGPYSAVDANEMVGDLEIRYSFPIKQPTRDLLIDITGGHPGLLGAAYRFLETIKETPTTPQRMGQLLLTEQSLWKECTKIWDSLLTTERAVLKKLSHGRATQADLPQLNQLKVKGLVKENAARNLLPFSPVFQEFIKAQGD